MQYGILESMGIRDDSIVKDGLVTRLPKLVSRSRENKQRNGRANILTSSRTARPTQGLEIPGILTGSVRNKERKTTNRMENVADRSRPLPPQQQQPPPVHQSDADDDDENVKQLGDCSALYLSLQDCLIKTNRNWKSCQIEVQALKACNERRNSSKGK
ncbi:hypothetical protein Nepgr_030302 [Nepenthes gracilis]|uniref:CHCH domain-containing protein n=1 Tax=Nepenthes gracilis TaxID=150966 RepID=A0AAD3TG27_NEPGR|nr:hypothetical protein Nepgr_030302 [Nepenthes gracilis]